MVAGVYCNGLYALNADNRGKKEKCGDLCSRCLLKSKISFEMRDTRRYLRWKIKGVIMTACHLAAGISKCKDEPVGSRWRTGAYHLAPVA